MRKVKKLFAVLLTLAMVLGMSATVFATNTEQTPSAKPTVATINGIEQEEGVNISVVAYQIIKYNDKGYYEEVLPGTIDKEEVAGQHPTLTPTSKNVQNLYYNELKNLKKLGGERSFVFQEDGSYTCGDLALGTWLVVVNGAKSYIYNPAIISVNQTPDGKEYGTLNLNTNTWLNEEGTYLKKDEPTITKTAESVEGSSDTNVVGTQFGDILKFTVTADIPAYTPDRTNIQYSIKDTLTGLDFVLDEEHPVAVKVGMDSQTAQPNEYVTGIARRAIEAAIGKNEKSFTVTGLGDQFLVINSNNKIIIEYYAKVTSTTLINVDRLNNKAELDYSNNTDTDNKSNHKETETKHYTFGIDTTVSGWKGLESSYPTGEFVKIDDKGNIQYTETPGEVEKIESAVQFLEGAQFQLHIGNINGTLFTDKSGKNTFTTDKDGRLQIVGLDDGVEYYLVETKAPTGYSLNATPVKVYIEATYEMDPVTKLQDVLTGYQVIMGEGEGSQTITHYGYDIKTGETEFINTPDTPSNPFGFKNTKLTNLPSTGGIGTTIFTIGGCLIMVVAAGLFFASRRKSAK